MGQISSFASVPSLLGFVTYLFSFSSLSTFLCLSRWQRLLKKLRQGGIVRFLAGVSMFGDGGDFFDVGVDHFLSGNVVRVGHQPITGTCSKDTCRSVFPQNLTREDTISRVP